MAASSTTPSVKAVWTNDYKGVSTTFRLVMNDSPSGGTYTVETRAIDATGNISWSDFVTYTTTTNDNTATRLTAKTLSALFDAIYT